MWRENEYDYQKYSEENYIAVCAPDYVFYGQNKAGSSDGLRDTVPSGQMLGIDNLFHERLLPPKYGSMPVCPPNTNEPCGVW